MREANSTTRHRVRNERTFQAAIISAIRLAPALIVWFSFTPLLKAQPANASPASVSTNLFQDRPLTLNDAVELALQHNSAILQARKDLEANYGIAMQARSIAIPQLKIGGEFSKYELNEMQNPAAPTPPPDKRWFGSIRLVQSVYEGGRIKSGVRTARLTKEQSQARYRAALADALLQVRTAYFDALLAEAQLHVIESSAELLRKQEEDARHRFEAGLVQKLDVLRAGVELANTAPKLARARHQLRLAQMRLANLTGLALPADAWSQPPFKLADPLHAEPLNLNISAAITRAFENRPEIEIQRKLVALQKERLVQARSGFKPSVQAFTGYGAFNDDLDRDLRGWFIGAQVNWDLFDGLKTQGRIREAEAELGKAELAAEDLARNVELEVRTAWSRYLEAQEILDSHKKVVEQAEEAWRLANSRFAAGEIAQLDLLTAQTALTEARATSVETLRDYNVALAQLEKAVGIQPPNAPTEMTK